MKSRERQKAEIFHTFAKEWPCLLTSGQGWEPLCWGMFLSCQIPRGSSAWLDLWRWDWNIFFFPHCLFPWGFVNWGITSQESLSKTNILHCMFLISTRAIISQCELKGRPRSWARQIESSLFRTKWGRGWFP